MARVTRVLLGFGANIGNREENLRLALRWLTPACRVVAVSSLYRSAAVVLDDAAPGPDFLNAACEIETDLTPADLLQHLKAIEHAIGRRPSGRWSPRPIDIDILLHGEEVIDTEDLTIPHPMISERNFVLLPLAELASDVAHPVLHKTIGELAEEVDYDGVEHLMGPGWATGAQPEEESDE